MAVLFFRARDKAVAWMTILVACSPVSRLFAALDPTLRGVGLDTACATQKLGLHGGRVPICDPDALFGFQCAFVHSNEGIGEAASEGLGKQLRTGSPGAALALLPTRHRTSKESHRISSSQAGMILTSSVYQESG